MPGLDPCIHLLEKSRQMFADIFTLIRVAASTVRPGESPIAQTGREGENRAVSLEIWELSANWGTRREGPSPDIASSQRAPVH
jgi:hypothetical protein